MLLDPKVLLGPLKKATLRFGAYSPERKPTARRINVAALRPTRRLLDHVVKPASEPDLDAVLAAELAEG